jgi:hypothetical protein
MIFGILEKNSAPEGSNLKSSQFQIFLRELSGDSEKIVIGSTCLSSDEINHQIDRCISDLMKLKIK